MNKVALIIITLILAMAVGLGGCVTISPPASSPPPEPTIDDIFLSRWGHTYYNNAPRLKYGSDPFGIEKLIIQTSLQVPWQLCYKAGGFDCSEMAAYLEYMLERHGYTAEIAHGKVKGIGFHAWVLVYNDAADCWVPIEATSPTGFLDAPITVFFQIVTGGSLIDYLNPTSRDADIYHVTRISEYDWWNSPYADQLVAASDRAKLAEALETDESPTPEPTVSHFTGYTIHDSLSLSQGETVASSEFPLNANESILVIIIGSSPIYMVGRPILSSSNGIFAQISRIDGDTIFSADWVKRYDLEQTVQGQWVAIIMFQPDLSGSYQLSLSNGAKQQVGCQYTIHIEGEK